MNDVLTSLWPVFALIVAGHAMKRLAFPGEGFWPGAERFNYFILFPALLFNGLVSAPLHDPALPRLFAGVGLTLLVCSAALVLCWRLRRWPAARFGVMVQGVLRFNTYLGLATISGLFGQPGMVVAAVIISVLVPTVNVLSVLSLTADRHTSLSALLLPIAKNPLILACVAGAAFNLAGLKLDAGTQQLLHWLAATSLPLGLLCVGAALHLEALKGHVGAMLANSVGRLVLAPGVAWLCAQALHLPALESAILTLFFALPTAPTSYVLTQQLRGDGHLMAGIITLQTLLSALSLPVVLALLR